MEVKYTPDYRNEREMYYGLAQGSALWDENAVKNISTENQYDFIKGMALADQVESSKFNLEDYKTIQNPEQKYQYLMWSKFSDDEDEETEAKNRKYFKAAVEQGKRDIIYNSLTGFEKFISTTGGILLTIPETVTKAVEGLVDLTSGIIGETAGLVGATSTRDAIRDFIAIRFTEDYAFKWAEDYKATYTGIGREWFATTIDSVISNFTRQAINLIPGAGQFLYMSSLLGNSYEELVLDKPNISSLGAIAHIAFTGAVEYFGDRLIEGYFIGGNDSLIKTSKIAAGIKNPVLRTLTYFGLNAAGEFTEESLEELLEGIEYQAFINHDKTFTIGDILNAGLIGALTSVLGGGTKILFTKSQTIGDTKLSKADSLLFQEVLGETLNKIDVSDPMTALRNKYSNLTEEQIKKEHAKEYETASKDSIKHNEMIVDTYGVLAKFVDAIGEEKTSKAMQLLNDTVETKANEIRGRILFSEKTYNDQEKKVINVYNNNVQDGSVFMPISEFTDYEYRIVNGVRTLLPGYDVVIGNVYGKTDWKGACIHDKIIFVNKDAVANLSVNDLVNKTMLHELIHTLQRNGYDLIKGNIDALESIMASLGIVIDWDKVDLKGYADLDEISTKAEKQAVVYTEMIMFNEDFINKMFGLNKSLFSKIYNFLFKKGKTANTNTKKGKILFSTVQKSMELYRKAITNNVANDQSVDIIADELKDAITQSQIDDIKASYSKGKVDEHYVISALNNSDLTLKRISALRELWDFVKDDFKTDIIDLTRLFDRNYYKYEFLEYLRNNYNNGDIVDGQEAFEFIMESFLYDRGLMYIPEKGVLLQSIDLSKGLKKDLKNVALDTEEDYKNAIIEHKLYSVKDWFELSDLQNEMNIDSLGDVRIIFKTSNEILDDGSFTEQEKKLFSKELDTLQGSYFSKNNVIGINLRKGEFSMEHVLIHELSHLIATRDDLYLGASPRGIYSVISNSSLFDYSDLLAIQNKLIESGEIRAEKTVNILYRDLSIGLYWLSGGEINAELHKKSYKFGTYDKSLGLRDFLEITNDEKWIFHGPTLNVLNDLSSVRIMNKQIDLNKRFKTIKASYQLTSDVKQFDKRNKPAEMMNYFKTLGLINMSDFEQAGFSEDFLKLIDPKNRSKENIADFTDLFKRNNLFDPGVSTDLSEKVDAYMERLLSESARTQKSPTVIYLTTLALNSLGYDDSFISETDLEKSREHILNNLNKGKQILNWIDKTTSLASSGDKRKKFTESAKKYVILQLGQPYVTNEFLTNEIRENLRRTSIESEETAKGGATILEERATETDDETKDVARETNLLEAEDIRSEDFMDIISDKIADNKLKEYYKDLGDYDEEYNKLKNLGTDLPQSYLDTAVDTLNDLAGEEKYRYITSTSGKETRIIDISKNINTEIETLLGLSQDYSEEDLESAFKKYNKNKDDIIKAEDYSLGNRKAMLQAIDNFFLQKGLSKNIKAKKDLQNKINKLKNDADIGDTIVSVVPMDDNDIIRSDATTEEIEEASKKVEKAIKQKAKKRTVEGEQNIKVAKGRHSYMFDRLEILNRNVTTYNEEQNMYSDISNPNEKTKELAKKTAEIKYTEYYTLSLGRNADKQTYLRTRNEDEFLRQFETIVNQLNEDEILPFVKELSEILKNNLDNGDITISRSRAIEYLIDRADYLGVSSSILAKLKEINNIIKRNSAIVTRGLDYDTIHPFKSFIERLRFESGYGKDLSISDTAVEELLKKKHITLEDIEAVFGKINEQAVIENERLKKELATDKERLKAKDEALNYQQKKLNENVSNLTKAEAEISQLEVDLNAKEAEIKNQASQLKDLSDVINSLTKNLSKNAEQIDSLKNSIKNTKEELKQARNEAFKYADKYSKAVAKKEEYAKLYKQSKVTLAQYNETIKQAETAKSLYDSMNKKIQMLEKNQEYYEQKIKDLEQANKDLNNQLNKVSKNDADFEKAIAMIDNLAKQNEELSKKLKDASNKKEIASEMEDNRKKINSLRAKLANRTKEINRLTSELDEKNEQINKLSKESDKHNNKVQKLKDKLHDNQSKLRLANKKLSDLEKAHEEYRIDNETYMKEVKALNAEISRIEQILNETQSQLIEEENNVQGLLNKINYLEEEKSKTILNLEHQVNMTKSSLAKKQKEYQKIYRQLKASRKKIDILTREKSDTALLIKSLENEIKDLQGQVKNLEENQKDPGIEIERDFYKDLITAIKEKDTTAIVELLYQNAVNHIIPELDLITQEELLDFSAKQISAVLEILRNKKVEKTAKQKDFSLESKISKIKGYRYFAMLSNPSTWLKNLLGNTLMSLAEKATEELYYVFDKKTQKLVKDLKEKTIAKKKVMEEELDTLNKELSELEKVDRSKMTKEEFDKYQKELSDKRKAVRDKESEVYAIRNSIIQHQLNYRVKGGISQGVQDYMSSEAVIAFVDRASQGNKYTSAAWDDESSFSESLNKEQMKIFKGKMMNSYMELMDKALSKIDSKFVKKSLIHNMSQILQANLGFIREQTLEFAKTKYGISDETLLKEYLEKSNVVKDKQYLDALFGNDTLTLLQIMPVDVLDILSQASVSKALEQYFKNSNVVSETLNKLAEEYPWFGAVISIINPFHKVAYNMMIQMAKYSPLGWIDVYRKQLKLKNQASEEFKGARDMFLAASISEAKAKATIGTVNTIVGILLAVLGKAVGVGLDYDENLGLVFKVTDAFKAKLSDLAPLTGALAIGSIMATLFMDPNKSLGQLNDLLAEYTILNVLEDYTSYSNSLSDAIGNTFSSYLQQFIPSVVRAFARVIDPTQKQKSTNYLLNLLETLATNIPGISYLVPTKIDPYTGTAKVRAFSTKSNNRWIAGFMEIINQVSPIKYTVNIKSDAEKLAEKYGAVTYGMGTKFTINGIDRKLTEGNISKYSAIRADYVNKEMTKLQNSSSFRRLSDKDKKSAIESIYRRGTELAKIRYWTDMGNTRVFVSQDEYKNYAQYLTGVKNIKRLYTGYTGSKYKNK